MGPPYAARQELASFHSISKGYMGECVRVGRAGPRTQAAAGLSSPPGWPLLASPASTPAFASQVRLPRRLRGGGEHGRRGEAADAEAAERAAVPAHPGPGPARRGCQPARALRPLLRAVPGGEWAGPRASGRRARPGLTNLPSSATGEAGGAGRASGQGQAHGAGLQRSSRHPLQPGSGRHVFLPARAAAPACGAARSGPTCGTGRPGRARGAGDVLPDRPFPSPSRTPRSSAWLPTCSSACAS